MKNWLKQYKWKILISTLLTMLPTLVGLLLWNRLPDVLTTHWGADGTADSFAGKAFAVFGLPTIMAGINLICCLATALDPKQLEQNKKALNLIFWITPVLSMLCCGMVYSIALGKEVNVLLLMPLTFGIGFIAVGNYMPKIKQNSTLGLRIRWTLCNEENWNRTHRFSGKVSVVCGVVALLSALLPNGWMFALLAAALLAVIIVPVFYSYSIYKHHRAEGVSYADPRGPKAQKIAIIISVIMTILVGALVGVMLFAGDIEYTCAPDSLQINADIQSDLTVSYEQIDHIELRETFDMGARVMGVGSVKLSMGTFQNKEFGHYTIYAYNACDSMILLHSGDKVLALNCATAEETLALYQTLLSKTG